VLDALCMLPPLASGLSPLATAATRSRRRLPGTCRPSLRSPWPAAD